MGCGLLSVVGSVAGAGLLGGAGLVPGLGGLGSLAGGLTGGLGGLGSLAGGLTGGLGSLAGGLGGLGSLGNLSSLGSLGGLANIPGLDGVGSLAQSFGAIGTDLIPDLAGSMGGIVDQVKGEFGGIISQATSVCGDAVKNAMGDVTGCLSGAMSGDFLSSLTPEGITFPSANLFDNVVNQSQSFLTNGIPGLTECISVAKGFCEQSGFALGSFENALNPQIDKLNFKDTFGQITGGMASSLLNPISGLNRTLSSVVSGGLPNPTGFLGTLQNSINQSSQAFGSLTRDMAQWGSMYPKDSINNFYSPIKIAENLVAKNIPSFTNYLSSNGINPTQVSSASRSRIENIFRTAPPNVVADVTRATNFQKPITQLTDVTEPTKVMSVDTVEVFKDFSGVAQQVASIGPNNARSFQDLGTRLNQVEFPRASTVINLEKDKTKFYDSLNYKKTARSKVTGSGSGVFGNPTMDDIMGSFHGTQYNIRLAGILQGQRKILASSTGQAFKNAVQQAITNAQQNLSTDATDAQQIRQAYAAMVNNTTNQEVLDTLNQFYDDMQQRLVLERRNLIAARIDPTDSVGGLSSVLNFVQSLDTAHQDDFQIGYRNWIENSSDTGIYGEAIRAAIVQGKNNSIAQGLGVDIATVSAVDYTDEAALAKARILSKCCPPYSLFESVPEEGTLLNTYCENYNLYGIYADGTGLSYYRVIEENSLVCGFTTTTTSMYGN